MSILTHLSLSTCTAMCKIMAVHYYVELLLSVRFQDFTWGAQSKHYERDGIVQFLNLIRSY